VDALFAAAATPQAPKPIDAVLLRQAFEKIAIDPYTRFLVECTSDLSKCTIQPGQTRTPRQWAEIETTWLGPDFSVRAASFGDV
jgi:hypothetical protein